MKNILWLTEWFPSSVEPYNGDGIERRAKAASLYNNICIIYVKKDTNLRFGKIKREERIYNEHCRAFIYYYPSIRRLSGFLDFLLSNYYFLRLHYKAFRTFKKKYGKPAGIQVNVTMKNGIIALYSKWLCRINYIIVEGWSLFLPESEQKLKDKGWLFCFFTRKVLKRASLVITISKHLGEMINRYVITVPYKVIPGVVDKTVFFPAEKVLKRDIFRFIHISNLDHAKNMEQILLAFKQVISIGYQAELVIHAHFNKFLQEQIVAMKLEKNIILKGEVNQSSLADSIRSSDALILFSLYETFGNVVIEAQACGLPVITSDYPTFLETVNNNINGIIARGKDAEALSEAMINFIKNKEKFDRQHISENASIRYSFDRIGKMLDEVYREYF
jgi:glycosyltransferase involved in cell wall biosynthesis